jgi:phosphate transport system ATP-binding protein
MSDATLVIPAVSEPPAAPPPPAGPADLPGRLEADAVSAWFGQRKVLDRVSIDLPAGQVTALIGPSGCGKSTFLRILNRMHELVPGAALAGEVRLDGEDIYDPDRRITDARRAIGMVFQKPNPFPAMSIRDNVLAGLSLVGSRIKKSDRDDLVEESLTRAGLWTGSASPARRCPAASSSDSASPARSRCVPGCCSWTSRARRSTPPRRAWWRRRSARSAPR